MIDYGGRAMKVIDAAALASWVGHLRWLVIEGTEIKCIGPIDSYSGTYSQGGLTASNVAEGLLTDFAATPIRSGALWLRQMIPPEPAPLSVMQYMLGVPDGTIAFNSPIVLYEDEPLPLLASMSWGLACDWEFDFIASPQHFLVRKAADQRLMLLWDQRQPMRAHLQELLANLEFTPC